MSKHKRVVLTKPYRLNSVAMRWVSSFASCAIEGNQLGIDMMELWNNGREDEFVARLEGEWQAELADELSSLNSS